MKGLIARADVCWLNNEIVITSFLQIYDDTPFSYTNLTANSNSTTDWLETDPETDLKIK